ncbi:putative dolichyl pyrophosphate Man9GlcNAc2 alpha-1,3-glucosyltransferase [Erysiphe neolycopersici]|uniref:Alpha-1,3-glucosyltransferase n=1 Tax=Erysiphe neolycopersici TaxID=212602 RepID=A0A420HJ01_9PEZI|nr:putative dolichyl pyrophosphate Man9GlcNAc2 alpha-1,3-glucosyltransferase [Erysiphe neolycopersici]
MSRLAPSHKPRQKIKKISARTNDGIWQEFPLVYFLWPARNSVSQKIVLLLILIFVGLFRWAAGLWGYSGYQKPPQFGDYEAQRHWMEVTTQLPISQWYFHDLEWWGLDYPPLTAYHSWLLGKLGCLINADWFALYTSRGSDDPNLKTYMRATVIMSEYLIYIPAIIFFVQTSKRAQGAHSWSANIALTAILLQPATILIDHVHFQFNNVMLGFVVASMSCILAGKMKWGCFLFVLALAFKQMALFYAPAIFAYLLGICIYPNFNIRQFIGISITTLASIFLILLPLIIGSLYDAYHGIEVQPGISNKHVPWPIFTEYSSLIDSHAWYFPVILQIVQVLHRIFPFARGLFEDKVANFWCALNIVVKFHTYPLVLLQRASFLATLAAIIPPCLVILLKPKMVALPLAISTTAWAFFLFGFQVHEKSILLPLMPMTLLLAGSHGMSEGIRAWVGFANILGVWTMFPLLQRVHLRVPYFILSGLWMYLLGLPVNLTTLDFKGRSSVTVGLFTSVVHTLYYLLIGFWHIVEAFFTPPLNKPDLWTVVNVEIGATGFFLCYMWCLWNLVKMCGLVNPSSTINTQRSRHKLD